MPRKTSVPTTKLTPGTILPPTYIQTNCRVLGSRLTFAFFGHRGRTGMKEWKSKKWLQLLKGDFLLHHNLLATKEIKKEPDQEAKFACKV